jgi:hypothetical protein
MWSDRYVEDIVGMTDSETDTCDYCGFTANVCECTISSFDLDDGAHEYDDQTAHAHEPAASTCPV